MIPAGDNLVGEASRVVVAEACIQALDIPCTIGQTYEISSVEVSKYFLLKFAINLVIVHTYSEHLSTPKLYIPPLVL